LTYFFSAIFTRCEDDPAARCQNSEADVEFTPANDRLDTAMGRLAAERAGNIVPLFALSLMAVMGIIGMTVDYTQLSNRKVALDAIADAAALAAVTPALLSQTDQASIASATTLFNSQASQVKGIGAITLSVAVSDSGLNRTASVTYQTTSKTSFGSLIGMTTAAISGTTQSIGSVPPNIDFYLLLDNSPSMAIAATTAGINTMVANTPDQCAFACHEADTSPNDYYGLARSLGVTLRMDMLAQATQNLMATAQTTAAANNASYRAAIYTFNIGFNTITSLTASLSAAQSQAANIQLYEVPYQNWSNDAITNYTNAMTQINSIMPNPGNGTKSAGDTPQEVMFFVTDGVEDQMGGLLGLTRVQSLMDPSYCTTIKNRGIRIAVLYTTYLPLPTNPWYNTYISPFQPNIGPTLQSCASPGLYFQVSTDQDISAAMIALFNAAVKTAYLSK
jgi:Flp pilus assembly protein TadG